MSQANVPLTLPIQLVTMPRQFDTVFNGKIYVGKPDTDPTAEENRVAVYQENEDLTLVPIAQPIDINAGGYPVVGGQVVKLVVTQDYSILVKDHLGAQAFYFSHCAGPYVLNIAHDQTLHGTGTEADPLGVKLSEAEGNLLEIRADGLYYGISASDDLLNLYVNTETGDDTNIGSREKPLKTLNEALRRTPWNKSNTIHLKAGQTFILDIDAEIVGCARVITPYDDPYIDGDQVPTPSPDNPAYSPWAARDLARPTIKTKINYNDTTHTVTVSTLWIKEGGRLELQGLIIDAIPVNDDQQPTYTTYNDAMIYGDATGGVNLFGCIFVTKVKTGDQYEWAVFSGYSDGGIPAVNMCRCVHLSGDYYALLLACPAKIFVTDDWPPQYGVPYQVANIIPATIAGKLKDIVRGPNGEPRNLITNVVV
ncbi:MULTISPECIES: phage tailspike protein [unclassified Serratia (in: enterobacteria)]|uniref:phage tailspike protein n=1 Tax=unclassified Serratia (in: enterobacteria) TaxID=2647522 RepID=UPI003B42B70D